MKKYLLFISCAVFVSAAIISSCNKINLPTELGKDIIPPVDNITTFDTTLDVETYNTFFNYSKDSGASIYSDYQVLGNISHDPIFGKTDARIYFQVLANQALSGTPGKRSIDSVVLVLGTPQIYGDTALQQNIQVSEIAQGVEFKPVEFDESLAPERNTGYPYTYSNFPTSRVLGAATVTPYKLKDSITLIRAKDTAHVSGQLRVRLDNAFGQQILGYDSATIANDTLFREKFNGFAVRSTSGDALMAFSHSATSLVIYYRSESSTTAGSYDTTSTAFIVAPTATATANYIGRDYSGTQISATLGDEVADPVVYLQNAPGTYAYVKIPGLKNLPNSVIHLAELQMESIYDPSDTVYYAPYNTFLDVYDSSTSKFKLMPYAFGVGASATLSGYDNFYSARSVGQTYYPAKDPSGNIVKQWRFNLTRYVQHVVSDHIPVYTMRLHAPAAIGLPLGDIGNTLTYNFEIPQSNSVYNIYGLPGIGRARIGGGNNPTQKMKLRIVYSKIPSP